MAPIPAIKPPAPTLLAAFAGCVAGFDVVGMAATTAVGAEPMGPEVFGEKPPPLATTALTDARGAALVEPIKIVEPELDAEAEVALS